MTDLMGLMKQAQAMQQKMAEAQEKLAASQVVGEAGAGLVTLTLSGKGEMRALSIDPSLLNPAEGEVVEDLVMAAHNDAKRKMEAMQQDVMKDVAGGLQLPPGMSMPG
ncbi:YbaB/EbfC family nucleoid-associated protein [uncultured Maricaulis sp.]|jgi:DNA-binding YbaB/EbfC family protein|uniref:YbaB/EbfC family nucleoid-associated protein n=1 Tax=uncultured Maricaulis sp. TaxID=174710 RepID=UPI0030DC5C8A|tara:strand:+ start:85811 stop:86134 length:324 start_codon:yes stop_codon:yes gene_type:complete